MKVYGQPLDINIDYISSTGYKQDEILFFDIETTGFAAAKTTLYLIGCVYYRDTKWNYLQWFADSEDSEYDILSAFLEFIEPYKALVHYNGDGFDIPYIQKKAEQYRLKTCFQTKDSIDIYKRIAKLKPLFKLDNMKQKTIELFLGIDRDDQYQGGELITAYHLYVNNHDPELENALLLHNHDDIVGMTKLLPLLSYTCFITNLYDITSVSIVPTHDINGVPGKDVIIELKLPAPVPVRVSYGKGSFYLTVYEDHAKLTVKAYTDELKYFYKNYKDYYYLPDEDRSIHKSVAFYVDKNFRTKAKAANCYSKKTGCFLPQYEEIIEPYFKIDYYDKITYFEVTEEFTSNTENIDKYVIHVITQLLGL